MRSAGTPPATRIDIETHAKRAFYFGQQQAEKAGGDLQAQLAAGKAAMEKQSKAMIQEMLAGLAATNAKMRPIVRSIVKAAKNGDNIDGAFISHIVAEGAHLGVESAEDLQRIALASYTGILDGADAKLLDFRYGADRVGREELLWENIKNFSGAAIKRGDEFEDAKFDQAALDAALAAAKEAPGATAVDKLAADAAARWLQAQAFFISRLRAAGAPVRWLQDWHFPTTNDKSRIADKPAEFVKWIDEKIKSGDIRVHGRRGFDDDEWMPTTTRAPGGEGFLRARGGKETDGATLYKQIMGFDEEESLGIAWRRRQIRRDQFTRAAADALPKLSRRGANITICSGATKTCSRRWTVGRIPAPACSE